MQRIYAPSPTVIATRRPLFNLGSLGDVYDDETNAIINSPDVVSSPNGDVLYDPNTGNSLDISTGNIYYADGNTVLFPPALNSAPSSSPPMFTNVSPTNSAAISSQIAASIAAAAKIANTAVTPLKPGASPRVRVPVPGVTTSPLQQQSVIKGVPDIALIGGGLLLVLSLAGGRR